MSKKYSDKQIVDCLMLLDSGMSIRGVSESTGIPKSTISDWKSSESERFVGLREKAGSMLTEGDLSHRHTNRRELEGKTFVITCAQNNVEVHKSFFKSLKQLCKHRGAQLVVSRLTYNQSSFTKQSSYKYEEVYDPLIEEYVIDEPIKLSDDLVFYGELNISPSAVNPLSSLDNYVGQHSGIVPHPKMMMRSLASHVDLGARLLYTTGTCTKMAYRPQKSGQIAEYHHVFGALIVEIDDDGDFFVRQINCDRKTGSFFDLKTHYHPDGWTENVECVEGLNFPDLHIESLSSDLAKTSFIGEGNLVDFLKPKNIILNDTLDFSVRNHHTISDPFSRFKSVVENRDDVEKSVKYVVNVMDHIKRDYANTVVVHSNHDEAMIKWLKTADYKTDPVNALFFLELQYANYLSMASKKIFNAFEYCYNKYSKDGKIRFLKQDESFEICGIECGDHGHVGINGSRGSTKQFSKLGKKYNVGHSHSAMIYESVYCAGVLTEKPYSYAKGPSSWSCSFIVTYTNGKRAIITVKNGKYRA